MREAGGGNGTLSLLALGSGTVAVVVMLVAHAETGATAIIASEGVSPEVVRGLDEVAHMIAHLFAIPLGTFVVTASTASLVHRVTWRWLGVLGIVPGLRPSLELQGTLSRRAWCIIWASWVCSAS